MSNKLLDELGLRAYLFVMGGGRPDQALRPPPLRELEGAIEQTQEAPAVELPKVEVPGSAPAEPVQAARRD